MPLGNLTSQFFANIYLGELDWFVKHRLKAKYYIRYVDDFIILHHSKEILENYKQKIISFLNAKLGLELHPDKSDILKLEKGIGFLGLRIFPHHKLLKKKNMRMFERKLKLLCFQFDEKLIDYDIIYDFLEGWFAYAKQANTYGLKRKIISFIEDKFRQETSTKEVNRGLKNIN